MLRGLAADLTGSADICVPVRDFEKCLAFQYLVPGETIHFSLQSTKEEFTFTNQGLIRVEGESATTTRKLIERFDYKSHELTHVKFETAGRVDRDCEVKFTIGGKSMSIDVATNEESEAIVYYKVLELLGREIRANKLKWELTAKALDHAATSLRINDASIQLTKQAEVTADWLLAKHKELQPRCYREFIIATLNEVRRAQKLM